MGFSSRAVAVAVVVAVAVGVGWRGGMREGVSSKLV